MKTPACDMPERLLIGVATLVRRLPNFRGNVRALRQRPWSLPALLCWLGATWRSSFPVQGD